MTILASYCIGPISQIPRGEGRAFEIGGKQIAVFHTRNGAIHAIDAACPHRGGPLADGLLGGSVVVCPLHGWKFELTTGATLNGTCAVETYEVFTNELGEITVVMSE